MSMAGSVRFGVGSVLGRSIWVLRRNVVVFGALALLFTWPSLFVSGETGVSGNSSSPAVESAITELAGPGGLGMVGLFALIVVVVLFFLILYMLATCTMVYGTFQVLRDRPVGVGDCIRHGLPAVLRVLGIAILTILAIVLVCGVLAIPGFLIGSVFGAVWIFAALLIPGMMIYTALWVAVPAAVVERTGVVESMKRSADLTSGYRWRVFGILLVLTLLNLAVEVIVTLPLDIGGIAYSVVGFALTAFFTAWGAVAAAVAYHDLRSQREGIGITEIAAVFE